MLKLHNSLTKKTEEFHPINPDQVGFYTCGPTVYDYPHLGNLRTYIYSDVLYRVLLANGLKVKFVMNLTDVDDKTIKKSAEENRPLQEVTAHYTQIFLADLDKAGIIRPAALPKATEEIPGMVAMIKTLLEKGIAYKGKDNSIYFNIAKFPHYGDLAQVDLSGLKDNADGRLNSADEYDKENARDFALWKAYSETDGNVYWDTELGKGRPGWHIECSVMSAKYLGQPFDIHMGGVDLIFPHHTNEIAQSEAAAGKPLANYWVHAEHLLVDNTKMSKSKNNFFTTRDILDKGLTLLAFRYLALTAHYRSKLNFSWDSLAAAQNALNNLYQMIAVFEPASQIIPEFQKPFFEAVNNDLDTPKALAVMWDMLKSDQPAADKLATLIDFDRILGLNIEAVWQAAQATIPDVVRQLLDEREVARKNQDFTKSDKLRQAIESNGYIVEDTTDGVRIRKKF
jgi:cysteinyl-tRNA synthetase